jgi:hypothetical protein
MWKYKWVNGRIRGSVAFPGLPYGCNALLERAVITSECESSGSASKVDRKLVQRTCKPFSILASGDTI